MQSWESHVIKSGIDSFFFFDRYKTSPHYSNQAATQFDMSMYKRCNYSEVMTKFLV